MLMIYPQRLRNMAIYLFYKPSNPEPLDVVLSQVMDPKGYLTDLNALQAISSGSRAPRVSRVQSLGLRVRPQELDPKTLNTKRPKL